MPIYAGDQTRLEVEFLDPITKLPKDISGSTSRYILIKYPDGQWVPFSADFVTDGTDGLAEHFTTELEAGDKQGKRGRLRGMGTDPWSTEITYIDVGE